MFVFVLVLVEVNLHSHGPIQKTRKANIFIVRVVFIKTEKQRECCEVLYSSNT